MAGEGEAGAEEEWTVLQGPCGEGCNEARGLERVQNLIVLVVDRRGRKVGGDEAKGVVLSAKVEEVVGLELALFNNAAAGNALCDGLAGARGGAPPLRRRTVGALHRCFVVTVLLRIQIQRAAVW